jgi:hypothetical protein
MSVFAKPLAFVKAHPVGVAIGVFIIGGAFILLRGGGGGSSASGDGTDPASLAAFYGAQSSQANSGNAVQAVQISTQADTAQALAADNAAVSIATLQTNASTTMNTNNNATILGLAPYNVQAALASGLSAALQNTPSTITTSTTQKPSFFGSLLGKSSKTSTTVAPNPAYASISDEITQLFSAMH